MNSVEKDGKAMADALKGGGGGGTSAKASADVEWPRTIRYECNAAFHLFPGLDEVLRMECLRLAVECVKSNGGDAVHTAALFCDFIQGKGGTAEVDHAAQANHS